MRVLSWLRKRDVARIVEDVGRILANDGALVQEEHLIFKHMAFIGIFVSLNPQFLRIVSMLFKDVHCLCMQIDVRLLPDSLLAELQRKNGILGIDQSSPACFPVMYCML